MSITYNDPEPQFTFPTTTDSDVYNSVRNVDNLEELTQYAKSRQNWYVNRVSSISNGKRLVNLWYYWNFLTWAGYKYFPKCVVAGLAWLVSGISSPWERRAGIKYYFMDTPEVIIETTGFKLPTYYLEPCGANAWTSTSPSYIYYDGSVSESNRIYFDDGSGSLPLSAKAYNSSMSQPATVGFGLCQWTNWSELRRGSKSASEYYGDGNSESRWDAWYPYNVSLQCFFLNYCKVLNDTGIIAAPGDYSWVKWQQVPDVDLAWTASNPHYDCIEMSWNQFCQDYTFDFCRTHTMSQNWLANDEGKFKITARQWQALFNNVGNPTSLTQDEQLRYENFVAVIKPCIDYWEENEHADILNMPEPEGTKYDPWHMMFTAAILGGYVRKRRKNNNVRTILF